MTAASTQQKLYKIFSQQFQVKRLVKQITDIKQLRQKGNFDIKMSMFKNQCFLFRVQVLPSAYKQTKLAQNMRVSQEVKFIVRRDYPATAPRLLFNHDNMSKLGLKPFRDYMPQLLATLSTQWSPKIQIQQLIRALPKFFQLISTSTSTKHMISIPKLPVIQQYSQMDNMLSWKFSQIYPIRLAKRNTTKNGFMYVDVFQPQIVFLEECGAQAPYIVCDFVQGSQILSLRKKKNTSNHFLFGMNGKYAIQFYSQDQQAISISVMECARISENGRKMSQTETKNQDSSSQSQEYQQSQTQKKNNTQIPTTINQIIQQILIYQSLVDSKMTSQNLSQLVALLQKAIQYYSAASDERFKIYLTKMQNILSNQMAQALLQSKNQQKKAERKSVKQTNAKKVEQYQSIIDDLI